MLLSADRDGSVIAHSNGVQNFPGAGQPAEVEDGLGAHLLAAGGFSRATERQDGTSMFLSKDQGGCEIVHRRVVYAWPEEGSVCEVPDDLGMELLRLGGYRVAEAPEPEPEPEDSGDDKTSDEDGDGGKSDAGADDSGEADGKPDGDDKGDETAKPVRKSRARSAAA